MSQELEARIIYIQTYFKNVLKEEVPSKDEIIYVFKRHRALEPDNEFIIEELRIKEKKW